LQHLEQVSPNAAGRSRGSAVSRHFVLSALLLF
jgi:hypothetical protein